MKEIIKNKKKSMAIVSLIIALFIAVWQNGGLDGIIINVPGADPIELKLPEGCDCDDCDECNCKEDECDCSGDICTCPNCLKVT